MMHTVRQVNWQEKRSNLPRENRRLAVMYRCGSDVEASSAFTSNISPQGMFVATSRLLEKGQDLEISVDLPGQLPIKIRGQVKWSRMVPAALRPLTPPGLGILITQAPERWYRFVLKSVRMSHRSRAALGRCGMAMLFSL